ncbi:hypothetical protein DCAR_0205527 [Daucus carota subsp. sativus]|uniref:F-box domain-containing protein n=2 Tax=Daucus carota subsp. sativus TaxID=79200 RepID=A0A166CP75_DAUCS|nr:hypothetical protein DCAR_0205527 [Daucus carota subsp. sativus]
MRMGKSLIDISEELQIEIFLKLPVKSLLLCKCVCKHFRCVIQNPNFVRTHLASINRSDSQSLVLLHSGWHSFYQLRHYLLSVDVNNTKQVLSCLPLNPPIPIIDTSFRYSVIGSCNGLICVAIWYQYDHTFDDANAKTPDFSIQLWNPVIRQCRFLPKHQSTCKPDVLEFGYVPEINDYVIVKVGSPGFDIEVYKMSADSWTTIHCNYFAGVDSIPTVYRVQTPVFLNGSFHWATKRSKQHRTNETDYIVYYKVKDEKVGIMNVFDNYSAIFDIVVDDDERSFDEWKLSVIDERLAMIHWCGERGNLFEVWVMNDYGIDNSWTRLFQIADTLCSYVNPMGYWTNGLMLLDRTLCWKRGFDNLQVFFFYDVETRSLKKIPLDHSTGFINGFSSFVETLVPVR